MDKRPEDSYPKEPNFNLFSGRSAEPPKALPAEEAGVSVRAAAKPRRGGMIALCIVAGLLLLIVSVACVVIIRRAIIIPSGLNDPNTAQTGPYGGDNPFARATTPAEAQTSATSGLDIKDPPSIVGTTPVENDGVLSVAQIAERIKPSVVSILVDNRYDSGLASGIIMTDNGVILTNYHVIEDMDRITAVLSDGTRHSAAVLGYDAAADLALLKIDASDLTPATFGNSDALVVGDLAVAVGTPYSLSLSGTTTQGIISAINRDLIINNRSISLIQTDATINPGNSGGPLVNKYGQVIGIVSMKIGEEFEGLGFAIPMNSAKTIIEAILNGTISAAPTPALGVNGQFLSEIAAAVNGLPTGFYITAVHEGSDAYAKGVRLGDVIVAIDGVTLADLAAFTAIKNAHAVGDVLTLTVYRDTNPYDSKSGSYYECAVTLMDEADLR